MERHQPAPRVNPRQCRATWRASSRNRRSRRSNRTRRRDLATTRILLVGLTALLVTGCSRLGPPGTFNDHAGPTVCRLGDDREAACGLAADALHGVDDEVAGANKKRALLFRVVARPTLDDPLEHMAAAPHDRERAVVAQLVGVAPVQAEPVHHVLDILLVVLLAVVRPNEVGVGLDLVDLLEGRRGHADPDSGQGVVAVERLGVGPPLSALPIGEDGGALGAGPGDAIAGDSLGV